MTDSDKTLETTPGTRIIPSVRARLMTAEAPRAKNPHEGKGSNPPVLDDGKGRNPRVPDRGKGKDPSVHDDGKIIRITN